MLPAHRCQEAGASFKSQRAPQTGAHTLVRMALKPGLQPPCHDDGNENETKSALQSHLRAVVDHNVLFLKCLEMIRNLGGGEWFHT